MKTVELAIGVLRQPPKENPQLREWAMTVVDTYSGIRLKPEAREELRNKAWMPAN